MTLTLLLAIALCLIAFTGSFVVQRQYVAINSNGYLPGTTFIALFFSFLPFILFARIGTTFLTEPASTNIMLAVGASTAIGILSGLASGWVARNRSGKDS